jgi:two-component system, OmpR family, phosphate regulon response regulator PhoB
MSVASKSILIIDNNKAIPKQLSRVLRAEGFIVTSVNSGQEAYIRLRYFPNLIILNPKLPDMKGLDFLRAIKKQHDLSGIPVFVLSNEESEEDEIVNLELGADYYIPQPVKIPLLRARIYTLFRRQDQYISPPVMEEEVIAIDGLSIHIPQFIVAYGQESIRFPKSEFRVIIQLAKNRGKVLTRQVLFNLVRMNKRNSDVRIIDVYITHIRQKLKKYAHYIETVPGVGYKFK